MEYSVELINSDVYNYEYFMQNDVCRFCWSLNAEEEITLKTLQNNDPTEICFVNQILDCLEIEITAESHPRKVCNSCYDEINKFHNFKVFCRETDRKLREILQNGIGKNVSEPEITVKEEKNVTLIDINESNEDFDNIFETFQQLEDIPKLELEQNQKVKMKPKILLKRPPSYCYICRLDLKTVKQLSYHNSAYHGIEGDGTSYKCFGCEKRFRNRKLRLGHEKKFCLGVKDGYRCSICDLCLPQRRLYEMHMRSHRNNEPMKQMKLFKCKKCPETFDSQRSLNEHVNEHKTVKKNYICETCGRVFHRQDYLQKHTLIHSGTKRHACPHPLCGFRATQRSSLTVHIRKHTGERPFPCDLCPQRCISSSNLRAHRRRHDGVKNYQCAICDKRFGYKVSLDEHVAATHQKAQPHACALCGAVYSRRRGLQRHLLAKHDKQSVKDATEMALAGDVGGDRVDSLLTDALKCVKDNCEFV